jgi:hypothetical protein
LRAKNSAALPSRESDALQNFRNSLVLFPLDDPASNLEPADSTQTGFSAQNKITWHFPISECQQ